APGMFWGGLTGFTSFVSHSGAPPFQIYVLPLRLPKMVYAGTNTILFAYLNAIKLVPYWALGQFTPANLKAAALLIPLAGLAVLAGVRLVKVLPQRLFFRLVSWALLLVSLKLLANGLRAA
ncbi:MAG: sulfite exporter TauE/SafE family protein, partial [Paracoccaceae bacterium]